MWTVIVLGYTVTITVDRRLSVCYTQWLCQNGLLYRSTFSIPNNLSIVRPHFWQNSDGFSLNTTTLPVTLNDLESHSCTLCPKLNILLSSLRYSSPFIVSVDNARNSASFATIVAEETEHLYKLSLPTDFVPKNWLSKMYKIYTQHCTIAATAKLLFPSAFNRFRLCVFRTTRTSIFWLKFGDFYSPQETLGFLVLDVM